MVHCKHCGKELTAEYEQLPRIPCPECSAIARNFSLDAELGGYVVVGGKASLIHGRPGLNSMAGANDEGRITLTATGPSPRNEEGAIEICARLVRFLNASGADWSEPREGAQDIDGCSTNSGGDTLEMQVVRASTNRKLWQEVNEAGSATLDYVAATLADELIAAIRKKIGKYPSAQRKYLVLVLDAARTPSHTFQQVHDAFQAKHHEECRESGFANVWCVGPHDALVVRLDR